MNTTAGQRVLVCGGRDYANYRVFEKVMNALRPRELIHGGAPGADSMADRYCDDHPGIVSTVISADWKRHGRKAGPIRNQRLLDECKPELVIAFPGGPGTADMVRRARRTRVTVLVVSGDTAKVGGNDPVEPTKELR